MSPDMKRLLLMNMSSMVIFNFIGIFVNLYIWQEGQRIFDVAWFNLVMFATWGFSFVMGAHLIKRWSTRLLIRAVAISGGITFSLLSFFTLENRILWIACIGVPVGIMWSLYALAQNVSLTKLGKGEEFSSYFAVSNIVGQVVAIVNPLLFAGVIYLIGYNGSFLLMFLFVALLLAVSFYIPAVSLKDEVLTVPPEKILQEKPMQWMAVSCVVAGFFLQFQGLFALVFTFSVSENKFIIALLSVTYTLFTILAMVLYRKYRMRNMAWLMLGMAMISTGFLAALLPHPAMLILSNVLTTIGMFYFGTIWNASHFKLMSSHTLLTQTKMLIYRELALVVTRIVMLALILSVEQIKGPVFLFLMAVSIASALITPFLTSKMEGAQQVIIPKISQ